MNAPDRLLRLFRYDTWANDRILSVLEANQEDGISEATGLFAHLVAAQQIWYGRITGERSDVELWPDLSVVTCRKHLEEMARQWENFIRNRGDKLDDKVTYTNSSGKEFHTMISDILHHVIIHGQHHRAQSAAELRRAGIEPPGTDFIFYVRSLNR